MIESELVTFKPMDIDQVAENAEKAACLLKALANKQRLMILCHLNSGEMSVTEINQQVSLSQSALSQHLARLRQDDLVNTRRDAQTIYYSLKPGLAAQIIQLCYLHFCSDEKECSDEK